jgi:hypothetical protein
MTDTVVTASKHDSAATPPRASDVAEVYESLMQEFDRRRRKLKLPSWKVDDLAGVQDGYFQKALHCQAPSGRQAGWRMISYLSGALFPNGVRVLLIPMRKRKRSVASMNGGNGHGIEITHDGPPKAVRDWLRGRMSTIGKKGGKARQRTLTREQRSELARKAARRRWKKPTVTEILPTTRPASKRGNGHSRD